jgi:hypothetical protein
LRPQQSHTQRDVAEETAYNIEYQGRGWTNPDSNVVYTKPPRFTADKRLCPVCGMDGDPTVTSVYKGKTLFVLYEGPQGGLRQSSS